MTAEVWGTAEIAEALDVNQSTVYRWIRAGDFPKPAADLRSGRVWDAEEVREWRRQDIAARRARRAF